MVNSGRDPNVPIHSVTQYSGVCAIYTLDITQRREVIFVLHTRSRLCVDVNLAHSQLSAPVTFHKHFLKKRISNNNRWFLYNCRFIQTNDR